MGYPVPLSAIEAFVVGYLDVKGHIAVPARLLQDLLEMADAYGPTKKSDDAARIGYEIWSAHFDRVAAPESPAFPTPYYDALIEAAKS